MHNSIQGATLPLAFLASGAAGLLFEVLWFRALGRLLGNTVWAGAIVLTAFMLGIALGGLIAARLRVARPARAFGLAELTVGATGALIVWLLPLAESVAGTWLAPAAGEPALLGFLRLAGALAVLLVPTTAMGLTLPLGVRALAGRDTAAALGVLYGANTFGACIAPLLAEYLLIEPLGLRGTALAAAALNALAAMIALRNSAALPPEPERDAHPLPAGLLAAAALAGALALGLEVVWFRLLLLHAHGTEATFATMLALFLAGIAAGGLLASRLGALPLAWLAAGAVLAVVLGYRLASPSAGAPAAELLRYAVPLMLPGAIVSGAFFTLLGSQLARHAARTQAAVGRLTFANTLGAAAGAALGGFVLLPLFGVEKALLAFAAGYVGLCALVAAGTPGPFKSRAFPVIAAAASLVLFPWGAMQRHLVAAALPYHRIDGSRTVQVTEGPTITLQVLRTEHFGEPANWRLVTDGYSMSGIDKDSARYMHLFAWLPAAFHPAPKRALLISYGAGNTAGALLETPGLESLTVVDVSPEILGTSPMLHPRADPLKDPRTRVVLEDGRHFLFTRSERFDVITGEPPPPMMAGVVNLYTREYFRALAGRLAPGGLATYWVPVRQMEPRGTRAIIAAFCDAFPDCTLWTGSTFHWILMGGRAFGAKPSLQQIARLWESPAAAPRLAASGFEHPAQLGATFLADAAQLAEWVKGTPPLVDDFPKRLAAPPRPGSSSEDYPRFLDAASARDRFARSRWIDAHWPAGLKAQSIAFYSVQPVLNGELSADPVRRLPLVDQILRQTELQVPVYWLLGSDLNEQEILERLPGDRPEYAYPRGVRALAERDYEQAAQRFAAAAEREPQLAGPLTAYSLCRAGKREEARRIKGAEQLAAELRCF